MNKNRRQGFTLLELVVAMTVMAVLAVVGFKFIKNYGNQARHIRAQGEMKTVAEGIDKYYLQVGRYPEFSSWTAMVDANSVLVKGNHIPANMQPKDPWKQDYEATCTVRDGYMLKCLGDPKNEFGEIVMRPGQTVTNETKDQAPGEAPK